MVVPGSTSKIEQLVGDYDNQRLKPTRNLTNTRYQLWGTDLGVPFRHGNRIYVLFGDVPGEDRDPIAYTEDFNPEDGLDLTFLTNQDGSFLPVTVHGITQGAFSSPMEGVSSGTSFYIFHTTDASARSTIAKTSDGGKTFVLLVSNFSSLYFINISVVEEVVASWPGLPRSTDKDGLIIFGSGKPRESNVYLAFQPKNKLGTKNELQYFKGLNNNQQPEWSTSETNATPLFDQSCVGEFSVSYNSFIEKWIMLYNCDNPRGINFRTADKPWGPWSTPKLIFDPWLDKGYCHFIHVDTNFQQCDQVSDPYREDQWGGEYGPYQFEDFATGNESTTTIYYTLSTWNPYTVVLMKSTLRKTISANNNTLRKSPKITCYPNPFATEITIDLSDQPMEWMTLCLYDLQGREMKRISNITRSSTIQFKRDALESGIYFYRIIDQTGQLLHVGKLEII